MGRVYSWLKCPHCRKVVERWSNGGTYAIKRYGSPFKTCQYCNKGFIARDLSEIATKPVEYYEKRWKYQKYGTLMMLGGLAVLFLGLWLYRSDEDVGTWGIVACLALEAIGGVVERVFNVGLKGEAFFTEYRASSKRLEDPSYALAIKMLEEME